MDAPKNSAASNALRAAHCRFLTVDGAGGTMAASVMASRQQPFGHKRGGHITKASAPRARRTGQRLGLLTAF